MSKFTSFEDNQINYELVNLNKVIYAKEGKGPFSNMHPVPQIGKNEASLLVAICPSYSFDFKQLSLVDKIPPISGKNLITLKKLTMQNHVILYVGIFEILTPLTFLRGISNTQTEQKLTLEQAKKDVEAKALEFETKFIEQEKMSMSYIFSELPNKEAKSNIPEHLLLTSEVRRTLPFKKIQEEITKFYYDVEVPAEKKNYQLKYVSSVNACVGTASQRIFKDFHAAQKGRKFHCIIMDEKTGETYELQKFMFRLMVEHLLDEMALVMVAGQAHNIDYFVHHISRQGKNKENTEMNRLLNMTKQLFLPKMYANKLFWQPIRFVESPQRVKEMKSNLIPSELPVIPEVKSKLIPVPIKRMSSGGSSSSSDEDKSPLSSSPPRTFYTESDTVTLAKDVYELLFDLVTSPDPIKVRSDLIETMKENNLKQFNLSTQKEVVTLKISAYKLLRRLAVSDGTVEERMSLLATYRRHVFLPDPSALDLLLTRNTTMEVEKAPTLTATPVPTSLNNNLPASTNINGLFASPQPMESKIKQPQSFSSPPSPKRSYSRSSSPFEKRGYGLYSSYSYPPGCKWQRKNDQLENRPRTLSNSESSK